MGDLLLRWISKMGARHIETRLRVNGANIQERVFWRLSKAVNEHRVALLHLSNIVQLKPMGTISYEEMAFHVSRLQIESGRKFSCGGWLAFHITRLFAQRDG